MLSVIIPLRIDHNDRFVNTEIVLNYLTTCVKEVDEIVLIENSSSFYYELMNINNKNKIRYIQQYETDRTFHRMKCINDGLCEVRNIATLIYDIDVLLPINVFSKVAHMILNEGYDIVQPFSNPPGCTYIHTLNKQYIHERILNTNGYDINDYRMRSGDRTGFAGNGFVVCVHKDVYMSIGGENEDFLAYGPEDNERYYRHKQLNKKIGSTTNGVYHLEHFRSMNSNESNPNFKKNWDLYNKIRSFTTKELIDYYDRRNRFKNNKIT